VLKKYPALSWTTIAGVITAALAVWGTANATGSTNWVMLVTGLVPIIAGALTHAQVVPVEDLRKIVTRARSAVTVANAVADKVDVALEDRPAGA